MLVCSGWNICLGNDSQNYEFNNLNVFKVGSLNDMVTKVVKKSQYFDVEVFSRYVLRLF